MTMLEQRAREAITGRAAEWLAAHRGGALSEAARAEFLTWLKASPVHVADYLALTALERALPAATALEPMPLHELRSEALADGDTAVAHLSVVSSRVPLARRFRRSGWLGLAALAACTCVLALSTIWTLGSVDWLPRTYRTAIGVQDLRRLPDGSLIHLDAASEVRVRYSWTERSVEVRRGQAYFEVAHEAARVFRVLAGGVALQDIGTRFDVERTSDTTIVTVAEGRVLVSDRRGERGGPPPSVPVSAGQQLRVSTKGSVLAAMPEEVDVRQVTAWLQRRIAFDHRPLSEVAEQFNRYSAIPFVIADARLRALRVSGVFNATDSESFASFLESLAGAHLERLPMEIRVYRAPGAAPAPKPPGSP